MKEKKRALRRNKTLLIMSLTSSSDAVGVHTSPGVENLTSGDGDAGAVWVFLMRFDLAHNHGMANFMSAVLRNVCKVDEFEGVCAFHALLPWAFRTFSDALAESSKFVGIGGVPNLVELGVHEKTLLIIILKRSSDTVGVPTSPG